MTRARSARSALVLLALGPLAFGQDLPAPSAFRAQLRQNPRLATSSGEAYAWHFAFGAGDFLLAYEACGDATWLDEAARHYDEAIARLVREDPDGYPGTFGGPFDDNAPGSAPVVHDTVVGDALLAEVLSRWAELVLADGEPEPLLGAKAREYLELVRRMCWDKIEHRGTYFEDRLGFGSLRTYGRGIDVASGKWVPYGDVISDNLNKHYTHARVLLRLWRITGADRYRARAAAIFARHKAMCRRIVEEDRVVWNFWMPHGEYDMRGSAPASWVAVHPSRAGYQAGEVEDFVEAYDTGVVFSRTDIERMVRTNLWMRAHGWKSADGSSEAGTLWPALARFDRELAVELRARLAREAGGRGQIRRAYYEKWLAARGSDPWERRRLRPGQEVRVADIAVQPGRQLLMATVIPDTVWTRARRSVQLAVAQHGGGRLRIELWDAAGEEALGLLAERVLAPGERYCAPRWNGKRPGSEQFVTGRYLVRYRLGAEVREWPVFVEPGPLAAAPAPYAALGAEERILQDFEGEVLGPRWEPGADGARTDERAQEGRWSLRVPGAAELRFGQDQDLPVRVRAWLFDDGTTRERGSALGAGIGVRLASGDVFAVRQAWRPYLDGNRRYAWFFTGQGQWFSPHDTRLARREGWRKWEFELDRDGLRVRLDGAELPVELLRPLRRVPNGAVGVVFYGAGAERPLFVDAVEVERL